MYINSHEFLPVITFSMLSICPVCGVIFILFPFFLSHFIPVGTNTFELVTAAKVLHVRAMTSGDVLEWIDAIREAIFRSYLGESSEILNFFFYQIKNNFFSFFFFHFFSFFSILCFHSSFFVIRFMILCTIYKKKSHTL